MGISEKEIVLVVDDDSANLMMAQQILGTHYNLSAAKSGAKALQYLESHTPDLILMDIKMPGMDGFETVVKIKENEALRGIPVIFLTADRNPETEKKCFDIGAVDYVTKPFVPDVLISRVARSLELEKHRKNLEILVADRTRELVDALRVKSDFLANMSHEIRTPMNAVLGMAEMALREDMTPAARDYIHRIRASGNNLLVILNDILDISDLESGKMEIAAAEYDIFSLINDVSGIMCGRLGGKELEFIADISPDMPKKLIGDSARIQQVMINLLNNAVKFTEKGQIKLSLSCERQDAENAVIKCVISDTGIGIKEEDIPKLFGAFRQLDSKRSRNAEGMGLGLKISKHLIELMGGSVGVESVFGQGSSFSFEIPQKISDNTPMLPESVESDISAGVLINSEYVKAQLLADLKRIGAKACEFSSPADFLNAEAPGIDFLITEKAYYTEELNNYFKDGGSGVKCVVIDDYDSKEEIINPNTILVRKPVYFLNLCAALGIIGEYKRGSDSAAGSSSFIAPDALVLIVDDNNTNLTVAKGLLEPLKMNVDTADSGPAAIELAKQKKYDMIFMDHMMPGMDGVEAAHIIRKSAEGYENVPIIALTANALPDAQEMFIREGMNDFAAKPVGAKTITEIVRRWLPAEKIVSVEGGAEEDDGSEELVIDGLNVENALSLLGSKNLYLTVLKDYYLSIDKKSAVIRDHYDSQRWRDYTIEVHSLKSTSRQIGADELSELAYELELAGNNDNISLIHEKTNVLLEMYAALKEIILPVFPECAEQREKKYASAETMLELLGELAEALENFDTLAIDDVVEKMSQYLYDEKHSGILDELTQAAEGSDIDKISELVSGWHSEIAADAT